MSTNIYLIIGGAVYNVNNGTPFLITEWSGLGALPRERLVQSGPLQDGDTDLGWRGRARLFEMEFTAINAGVTGRMSNRRTLMRYLAPQNSVSVRFDFDGDVYQIDAQPLSDGETIRSRDVHCLTGVPTRWKAADPTFYDPAGVAVSFNLGGGGDALVIPMTVPMVVGASTLYQSVAVSYAGDVKAYPSLIRITGPITNCVITNETTGEKLDFTGTTIAGGTYYDIDLRYANKTVVDSAGASQIATLTDDSNLATFHIAPSVNGAPTRSNSFRVTGSSVTAATDVQMAYFTRYSGI